MLIAFAGCAYYNMISGVLRGMGDSIMPLIYLIITCLLNIILDIVFVAWFHLGVPGVAVNQVLIGVMRGAGDTVTPMITSVLSTVVIRVPVAYLLAYLTRSDVNPMGNPASIFYSLMISWVLGAVMTAFVYKFGKWNKKGSILQSV